MRCHPDIAHRLDFDSILKILSQFCLTAEGVTLIGQRTFLTDEQEIERELTLVTGACALLPHITIPHPDNFPPVAQTIKALLDPRSAPEPIELYRLACHLQSVQTLCTAIRACTVTGAAADAVRALCAEIPDLTQLSKSILQFIDEEGSLIISHIELLELLHQQRMDAARSVEHELNKIYRRNANYYQSASPVVRNSRFCLALNADFLGRVPSVVVDQSSSGSTLFIEPIPCVELNNRWVRYGQKFETECRAFIRKLTNTIRESLPHLQSLVFKFSFLDSIMARAQFSRRFDCTPATFTSDGIVLSQLRHPLLEGESVPIDIAQAGECYATVISGPNGGGKTVTLKSIGLMILMHYFGIPLPAAAGSRIPRCSNVLLLIGDQQSILSHRSSFTAQMQEVTDMLRDIDDGAVVLFDELGGNTDPEEGAALATAIVCRCVERQARTFVTTHFTPLKQYATTHQEMQLVSMEYDHQTNQPRFVVAADCSEGSHALDMAAGVGLPADIIATATALLSRDAIDYKTRLSELTHQQQAFYQRQDALLHQEAQLQQKEQELQKREDEVRHQRIGDIERLISSSRRQLERLIAQLREKNVTLATKRIHSQLDEASTALSAGADRLRQELAPGAAPSQTFAVGDAVQISGQSHVLSVSAVIDDETVEVSGGKMRMRVSPARLQRAPVAAQSRAAPRYAAGAPPPFVPVIDIRGKYADEIEPIILRQIDSALYNNQTEFAIIHGIGSGALQQAVADMLEAQQQVAAWQYAAANDGGRGKTIVRLAAGDDA